MSLAGAGLPLVPAAAAEGPPITPAHPLAVQPLPKPPEKRAVDAAERRDEASPNLRTALLRETLPAADVAVVRAVGQAFGLDDVEAIRHAMSHRPAEAPSRLSNGDRDAIALAMVSMEEPALLAELDPTRSGRMPRPSDPAGPDAIHAMLALRQPERPPAPIQKLESTHAPGDDFEGEAALDTQEHDAAVEPSLSPHDSPPAPTAIVGTGATAGRARVEGDSRDLHLAFEFDLGPAPSPEPAEKVERASGLDLNLDLAWGLDLNLDLTARVDLQLDLGGGAGFGMFTGEGFGPATNSKPAPQFDQLLDIDPAPTAAAGVSAPKHTEPPGGAAASTAETAETAAVGTALPRIVVATHAQRVLRSLETLLNQGADATAPPFGAQSEEIFVGSEAEKALQLLASLRDRPFGSSPLVAVQTGARADAGATMKVQRVVSPPAADEAVESVRSQALSFSQTQGGIDRPSVGQRRLALSQSKLDKVRGGFRTDNGLTISFGIERAVYINGSLVTTTSLNVSDLGKATVGLSTGTPPSAGLTSAVQGGTTVIQNGVGNTFVTGPVNPAALGTIVQNTLNDQKIQSLTQVNATVNSLQMLNSMNFQSSLRGALIDSLRR